MELLYRQGNELYSLQQYDKAATHYGAAIAQGSNQNSPVHPCDVESRLLVIKCLLNRSQCYLQLREYERAIADCSACLLHDASNVKSYLRRAMAYEYIGDFGRALEDVSAVLQMSAPAPPASLLQAAVTTADRLRRLKQTDEATSVKEGVPASLVDDRQVLRLNIMESTIGNVVSPDCAYYVRLCVGNEFGLWNRKSLTLFDSPPRLTTNYITVENQTGRTSLIKPVVSIVPEIMDSSGKFNVALTFPTAAHHDVDDAGTHSPVGSTMGMIEFAVEGTMAGDSNGPHIVPVISLPFAIRGSSCANCEMQDEQHDLCSSFSSPQYSGVRYVDIDSQLRVYAFESSISLGIAGKVWDSTFVLLDYCSKTQKIRDSLRGKRIVELGSGTGIAGLGLASLEPRSVILTDMPDVVPLIDSNILLNSFILSDPSVRDIIRQRYSAQSHVWGDPVTVHNDSNTSIQLCQCDVIVASDVVYDPIGYEPLIKSLQALLAPRQDHGVQAPVEHNGDNVPGFPVGPGPNSDKFCILAHRHRHPQDIRFFDMIADPASGLHIQQIDPADYCFDPTGLRASTVQLSDVKIFHIKISHQ